MNVVEMGQNNVQLTVEEWEHLEKENRFQGYLEVDDEI